MASLLVDPLNAVEQYRPDDWYIAQIEYEMEEPKINGSLLFLEDQLPLNTIVYCVPPTNGFDIKHLYRVVKVLKNNKYRINYLRTEVVQYTDEDKFACSYSKDDMLKSRIITAKPVNPAWYVDKRTHIYKSGTDTFEIL